MKLGKCFLIICFVVFFGMVICKGVEAEIIFQDDFDGYSDSPANHGWGVSSNISMVNGQGVNESRCAMVTYVRSGTSPYWFGVNVGDLNRNALYIRFYFKVDDPSGGCKFLKLFGKQKQPEGYANTTVAIKYTSSLLYEISYGNGGGTTNDTQTVIRYAGEHSDSNVNVLVAEGPFDPRDGKWHSYEFYMKYNDDGKRNGEYKVWIDGQLRVHAVNIKNRHDDNSNEFGSVQLANYCHSNWEHTWNLWYDNVVIADEYIGPLGSSRETDYSTPTTSTHDPARSVVNVPVDSNILVHVQDTDDDVDQSSIVMTVNGERVNPAISGSSADYTVSYDPSVDFTPGDVVTVTVDAQDQHNPANVMAQDRYSFTIADAGGEDKQPGEGDTKVFGDVSGSDYRGTCQDTFVNAGARSSNYSNDSQTLNTYTWPTNTSANRVVMKWDLSAIPQNATIHEATLSLDMYSAHGDESYEVSAHRIVTNNPNISSCTWNTYDGTHSWTGGANGGEQALAPAESTAIVDRTAGYKNCSITQMVQQWVSNPYSNYGLMLDSDSTAASDSNRLFRPTEYSNPDQRPKLTVTYSDSSKISSPENLRLVH
jgi:hypothetical protein